MKHLLLIFLFPTLLAAQSPVNCYTDFRNKGLEYMAAKDFGEAISQFVAALVTCKEVPSDNDLSRRIEESKKKWAAELQASVTEAQKAYHDALAAKLVAENAKSAESQARLIAEENARRAYQRGVRSESYRLALLADMARQQNLKTDALLLSWMGLQLSDTLQPFVMRAFGDAVRDSFARAVFSSQQEILSATYFDNDKQLLVQTAQPAWFVLKLEAPTRVTELPNSFTQMVPAPDGRLILAWGKATTVTLLTPTGKIETTLRGHLETIRSAAWSADSRHIITCSRDNTARIWANDGRLIATLEGHTANVQAAMFSPDGNLALTRSSDGTAKLWDMNGRLQTTFSDLEGMVQKAFISSSNIVFIQYTNNKIDIRGTDGRLLKSIKMEAVYHPQFYINNTGDRVVAQVGPRNIQVLDKNGAIQADVKLKSDVTSSSLSEQGNLLTCTKDFAINLWNQSGQLLHSFSGHRKRVFSANFTDRQNLVISNATDGSARLWDQSGSVLSEWKISEKGQTGCMFSQSGTEVCIVGDDGKSILISPLPSVILANVNRNTLLASPAAEKVKSLYAIQFWEVLLH